jgi:hypothetical protein
MITHVRGLETRLFDSKTLREVYSVVAMMTSVLLCVAPVFEAAALRTPNLSRGFHVASLRGFQPRGLQPTVVSSQQSYSALLERPV